MEPNPVKGAANHRQNRAEKQIRSHDLSRRHRGIVQQQNSSSAPAPFANLCKDSVMIERLSDHGSRQDAILSRSCIESEVQHLETAGMWVR